MNKYERLNQIGKGSFGVITKIRRKSDDKYFVSKELFYGKMSEREKKQLVAAIEAYKKAN